MIMNDAFEENQTENTTNSFDFEIAQNGDKSNNDDSTFEDDELIIKKTKNHNCYICDQSIGSLFYTFLKHLILVHFRQNIIDHFQLQDNIVCPICKKKFSKRYPDKASWVGSSCHLTVHSKTKNYTCYICGKSFESVSNLMQHLILLHFKHDIINQFYLKDDLGCPICKKPLLEKSCLIIHLGSDHQAILKYIPKFLHNVFYPETKALKVNIKPAKQCPNCDWSGPSLKTHQILKHYRSHI